MEIKGGRRSKQWYLRLTSCWERGRSLAGCEDGRGCRGVEPPPVAMARAATCCGSSPAHTALLLAGIDLIPKLQRKKRR